MFSPDPWVWECGASRVRPESDIGLRLWGNTRMSAGAGSAHHTDIRVPRHTVPISKPEGLTMLMTIAIILIVLWLLGLVTSYTMGGLIHVLLVIAIIVVLVRLIQGRRIS
jgi:hypothetical protein